jgi:hypothetical protein
MLPAKIGKQTLKKRKRTNNEGRKMRPVIDFARAPAMEISSDNRCIIKTVYPENIFTFPEGILGFENIKDMCSS